MEQALIEKAGEKFSPSGLMAARERTWEAVRAIRECIQVGMTEEEAHVQAKKILAQLGSEKEWHRPLIRFGENTLKTFREPSAPGLRLTSPGIFFIDIGPVWKGHEGDAGATFVVGEDADMRRCAEDAERIFHEVRDHWLTQRPTGQALYLFAEKAAERRGWALNLGTDGHRVSDFPHAAFFRGGLGECDFVPSQYAWILEIQIRHPEKYYGAFFEDVLN